MIAIIVWYTLLFSIPLALAALALERFARLMRWPLRWGWSAAFAMLQFLPVAIAVRLHTPPAPVAASAIRPRTDLAAAGKIGRITLPPTPRGTWGQLNLVITRYNVQMLLRLTRIDRSVRLVWFTVAGGLALLHLAGWLALRRRMRRWRADRIAGVPVLRADHDGPAIVGIIHPQIVVPVWVDEVSLAWRELLLRHEIEHALAGDQIVVHLARFFTALVPWNPFAWWVVNRLRLATEIDCDARVLASAGPSATSARAVATAYGELLLAVAAHRPGRRLSIASPLLDPISSLSRRITAMSPIRTPFLRVQRTLTAGAAVALVALAFGTPVSRLAAQVVARATSGGGTGGAGFLMASPRTQADPVITLEQERAILARYYPRLLAGEVTTSGVVIRDASGKVLSIATVSTVLKLVELSHVPMTIAGSGLTAPSSTEGGAVAGYAIRTPSAGMAYDSAMSGTMTIRRSTEANAGVVTVTPKSADGSSSFAVGAPRAATGEPTARMVAVGVPHDTSATDAEATDLANQLADKVTSIQMIRTKAGDLGPNAVTLYVVTLK